MIQVKNLSKAYGEQILFEDVGFSLSKGERLGLVGRNGHGKTTLFKIITGEVQPDSGVVVVPGDYRIGHLSQQINFSQDTVLEEGTLALVKQEDGWQETYRLESALFGLGFSKEDLSLNPRELSGGFQIRLQLAKLLVSEANLLLLDEPGNYLDIVSLRWLVRFLNSWRDELIIITHDRTLMDQVTTHTMAIHRSKLKKIKGGTEKIYEQIQLEEEVREKTRINQGKKIEKAEEFIRKFRAKARTASRVQSRIKALEKITPLEKLEKIEELEFKFNAVPFPGKYPLQVKDLCFDFNSNSPGLIQDLNLTVQKNDRIAVVGKNGKGKTTLLNLLATELPPDNGTIEYSPNLEAAYFGQTNVDRLDPEKTIEEEILSVQPDHNRTLARGICGLMMFTGDLALKKNKILSGGEKSRVLLGKILVTPANLLLLDEPSNHLDQESTCGLLEALIKFPGAVIIVTHSEMILHKLANRLLVFDGEQPFLFNGSYSDFLERVGWCDEDELRPAKKKKCSHSRKEQRQKRAAIITERSKVLGPLKSRIDQLEERIIKLEERIEKASQELIELSKEGFGDQAAKLSRMLGQDKTETEELFQELEEVFQKYDKLKADFEKQLDEL